MRHASKRSLSTLEAAPPTTERHSARRPGAAAAIRPFCMAAAEAVVAEADAEVEAAAVVAEAATPVATVEDAWDMVWDGG